MIATTARVHVGDSISAGHNRREKDIVTKEPHIIAGGVYEVWRDDSRLRRDGNFEQLINEEFAEDIEAYNKGKQRKKIGNYYRELEANAKTKSMVREIIIGVGTSQPAIDEETGLVELDEAGEPVRPFRVPPDISARILREFLEEFEERNEGNIKVVGAYFHADEAPNGVQGEAHIHLDVIGIGTKYERGMSRQVSWSRAMQEQTGESNGARAFAAWITREREALGKVAERHGVLVMQKDTEALSTKRVQMSKEAYIRKQEAAVNLARTVKALEAVKEKVAYYRSKVDRLESNLVNFIDPKTGQNAAEYIRTETKPEQPQKEKTYAPNIIPFRKPKKSEDYGFDF